MQTIKAHAVGRCPTYINKMCQKALIFTEKRSPQSDEWTRVGGFRYNDCQNVQYLTMGGEKAYSTRYDIYTEKQCVHCIHAYLLEVDV